MTNNAALAVCQGPQAAPHTIKADDSTVEVVQEMIGGHGAETIIDFVGEGGAVEVEMQMLRHVGN